MFFSGIKSTESIRVNIHYVFVYAFVIGMLLTPPDIISQTMLAVPMLILFEAGIIIASLYHKDDEGESCNVKENH